MSDQKPTVVLVGSVVIIAVASLSFAFAQDDGDPILGAAIGALVALGLCIVALIRPRDRNGSPATVDADRSATPEDLRQRRNLAALRFAIALAAIMTLWLIVFFVL